MIIIILVLFYFEYITDAVEEDETLQIYKVTVGTGDLDRDVFWTTDLR